MDDRTILGSRWEDTEYISYHLPDGSRTVVAEGSLVRIGDAIAFAPSPPTVVAFADELHVTTGTSTYGIIHLDTMTLVAGDRIGARRSGLRIHTLRAPTDGTVAVIPSIGALTLRHPDTERPIVATASGTVVHVMTREIIIAVTVQRVRFAFAAGMGKGSIVPRQSVHDAASPIVTATRAGRAFFTLPHIDDIASLLRDVKARPGPRMIGTVSEEVAWHFLKTRDQSVAREFNETPVIVLDGVGRPDVGRETLEALGDITDAQIAVLHRERFLTMYRDHPAAQPIRTNSSAPHRSAIRLRDPARWDTEGHTLSQPTLGALASGARTMIVRIRSAEAGVAEIPLQNISVKDEP